MATFATDFFHLRTTVGLARQARSHAGKLRRKNYQLKALRTIGLLHDAIEKGLIDGVVDYFEKEIKIRELEGKEYNLIVKDNLIEIREEWKVEKKENTDNERLNAALKKLNKMINDPKKKLSMDKFNALYKALSKESQEKHERISEISGEITNLFNNLLKKNKAAIELTTIKHNYLTLNSKFRALKKYERRGKWDIKKINSEIKKYEKLLNKIEEICNNINRTNFEDDFKIIEKCFSSIYKLSKDLYRNMIDEVYEMLFAISICVKDLLDPLKDVDETLPEIIKDLQNQRFPELRLALIRKKHNDFRNELMTELLNLFKMAYYDQRKTRSA